MFVHNYKLDDLIIKTVVPVTVLWSLILFFAFYKPYKVFYKKEKHLMSNKIYLILLFPYIWAIQTIMGVSKDVDGQGMVIDRPACLNLDVPKSLKKMGFISMYKPACRSAQQKLQYEVAGNQNKTLNYILNILFLLILIFISVKARSLRHIKTHVTRSTAVLVFILILGSLASSGFINFPWRAYVFARISMGLIVCAATLLTFMIFAIFVHIYTESRVFK